MDPKNSNQRHRWLAAPLLVLLVAGCGGSNDLAADDAGPTTQVQAEPEQPTATEEFDPALCADLDQAVTGAQTLFDIDELSDMDVEISQQTEDLLLGVAEGFPTNAPAEATQILEAGATLLGALGDAAEAENPQNNFITNAGPAQELLDSLDWDPTEQLISDECGIDVLGIELKLRSDDRTEVAPAE